jgi:hypothetical protein
MIVGLERRTHTHFPEYLEALARHVGNRSVYRAGAQKHHTSLINHMLVTVDWFVQRTLEALRAQRTVPAKLGLINGIRGVSMTVNDELVTAETIEELASTEQMSQWKRVRFRSSKLMALLSESSTRNSYPKHV